MELFFEITNQKMERIDIENPVNSSQEYLKLSFDFKTDDWDDTTKFIFFRVHHINYSYPLTDNSIIVPSVFVNGKHLDFGVYGVGGEDYRITTNSLRIKFRESEFWSLSDAPLSVTELIEKLFEEKADLVYVDTELADKVDKVDGKELSSNDFTDEYLNLIETHQENINDLSVNKVDKVDGKELSSNDFTNYYKNFLDGFDGNIEAFLEDHKEEIEALITADVLAAKADKTYVDSELDKKADIIYVDGELDLKVNNTTFNDAVESINTNISELDTNKTDKTVFNETVNDLENNISDLDTNKTITITKQATADTGYFSTYVINQGGVALSPKINIPKDYLLKSASLKQCTVKDEPIGGLNVGDWYFDWVLNTADETEESHLYLNANVLTDVYEGDNETIIITDNVISVKPNVFAFKVHTHTKSDITDFSHTHSKSDITDFNHDHDDRYYTETEMDTLLNSKSDVGHTHTESDITDLQDYALEEDVYSKSEVDELIHNLQNNIKVNSTNKIIQTDETTELYAYCKEDGMPTINKKVHFYQITEEEPTVEEPAEEEAITSNDD